MTVESNAAQDCAKQVLAYKIMGNQHVFKVLGILHMNAKLVVIITASE